MCFVLLKSLLLPLSSLHESCGFYLLLFLLLFAVLHLNGSHSHKEVRGHPLKWRGLYVQALIWQFRGFLISVVTFMDGDFCSADVQRKLMKAWKERARFTPGINYNLSFWSKPNFLCVDIYISKTCGPDYLQLNGDSCKWTLRLGLCLQREGFCANWLTRTWSEWRPRREYSASATTLGLLGSTGKTLGFTHPEEFVK